MEIVERPVGKLGHKCPDCSEAAARPLKPGQAAFALARPIDLHWSKKAPGEVECPNCGGTFPVAAPPEEPKARKKGRKAEDE